MAASTVASTVRPVVTITVYSDIACPWCAIGNLNLKAALARQTSNVEFKVHYRPYVLHPEVPEEGMRKAPATFYGQRVRGAAAEAGLALATEGYLANTIHANRLVWFAGETTPEKQLEVVTRLFRTYFVDGRNVGDLAVLEDVAAADGLDRAKVRAFLQSDKGRAEVMASTREAKAQQINGVPHYVFSDAYALTGGQSVQVFEQVLRARARQELRAAAAKL